MSVPVIISFFACLFFTCFPSTAYAYLDAGTGSMILQALAVGFIAVAAFWRRIMYAIKGFFKKDKDQS